MAPYTRMVPRARTRIGEIDLECACGDWIPYPADDGDERMPTVCENCGTEWHVHDPMFVSRRLAAARRES
jgi:hypothetical protein